MDFYIVDVFAESKYTGNQLAVLSGSGVESLTDEEMLAIAREMNYSETTFITESEPKNGGYDVRIFTPKKELPFAGHPTLGTAYILREKVIKQPEKQLILNLKVGQIPVNWDETGVIWMEQNQPAFGQKLTSEIIAAILNLEPDDIDGKFPIQAVSTGVPFLIIPLKNHTALKQAQINSEKYTELIQMGEATEILIFCRETYHTEND